jgi:ArsR family metal-binding transcriptional regulator
MAFLNEIKIVSVLPCIAMPERIRFIAELDRDISEILPYLNAVIDNAIYNHEGKNITMKKGDRMIGIQAKQFAAGKVIDLKDAEELIKWFKELVNDTYSKKDFIKPNYERRRKLTAMDIYKLLPATNCKKCGEPTCMAFAVKLASEEKNIIMCVDLFSGKFNVKRDELLRVLKSCGYSVPSIFAKEN